MNRIVAVVLALTLIPSAGAQLYKWVDKDGKTHYSDQPPPGQESKQLNVQSGAATAAAPPKSFLARDKELDKGRQESREAAKKADDAARLAQERDENCSRARSAYATYADGGRIHKYNDKGERVYLDDQEIEVERERAKREMDEACKKP